MPTHPLPSVVYNVTDCKTKLYAQDGALIGEQQVAAYILAAQSRSWRIPLRQPWRGGKLKIVAQTSGGDVSAEIVPD